MTTCCQKNVFIASEAQERRIRELEAQLAARTPADPGSDAAITAAERAALLDGLGAALAIIAADGGYRKSEAQSAIRGLRALHAELGGKP